MSPRRILAIAVATFVLLLGGQPGSWSGSPFGTEAWAKPKKPKRHYFELSEVKATVEVEAKLAAVAEPRVKAKAAKTFQEHTQVVSNVADVPVATDAAAWKKFLTKHKVAGAYKVNVEIIEATEEVEPLEGRSGQRLTVRLTLRMFGETMPKRVMAFAGEGSSTIKQEIGKKLRDVDRNYVWDQAAELAMADALKTSLKTLANPPPPPKK